MLGRVFAEQLEKVGHVVLRFVGDALAALIHDAVPRQGFLDDRQPGNGRARHGQRRAPPGAIHQPGGGAEFQAGSNGVAGIVFVAGAPFGVGGLRQILLAHLLVVLESAGRQHHAPARLNADRLTLAGGDHADHPARVVGDQILKRGFQPERYVAIHHRQSQARDTCSAIRQAP